MNQKLTSGRCFDQTAKSLFKGRLHEPKKCPFSAPILGPQYVVNHSVLALKTVPFYAHVNAPLQIIKKYLWGSSIRI